MSAAPMPQASVDAARAGLAMLQHGFADYAEAIIAGCGGPPLRPALAQLRAGDAQGCVERLRQVAGA